MFFIVGLMPRKLKNIMKRPVSMPCTEAQFEAMKPKLKMIKGVRIDMFMNDWIENPIITNNYAGMERLVNNVGVHAKERNNRTFYPEFNEQIFLEACEHVSYSLEERVAKLEEAVLRLLKTEDSTKSPETKPDIDYSRIKAGSMVMLKSSDKRFYPVNEEESAEVIFWITPHYVNNRGIFVQSGLHHHYCTFFQDDEYVFFGLDKGQEIDFISKVIQY